MIVFLTRSFVLFCGLLCFQLASAAILVIGHQDLPFDQLKLVTIQSLFLEKTTGLKTKKPLVVFNQPSDSPVSPKTQLLQ